MNNEPLVQIEVRLSSEQMLVFEGVCLGRVVALDHDGSVRRQFSVYSCEPGFVLESLDWSGGGKVRSRAVRCDEDIDIYHFFGNEPLANYLYGVLRLSVPGLRVVHL